MTKDEGPYKYLSNFQDFREEQKRAHYHGMREGQQMFEKYMPATAVDLLKSTNFWEIPYRSNHPTGIQLMEGALPEQIICCTDLMQMSKAVFLISDDVDFDFNPEENDENERRDQLEDQEEEKEVIGQKEDKNENLVEEEEGEKHQKWKMSKVVGGRMTHVHVKQALNSSYQGNTLHIVDKSALGHKVPPWEIAITSNT